MELHPLTEKNGYQSPEFRPGLAVRMMPGAAFYMNMARIVLSSSKKAKRGKYGDIEFVKASEDVLKSLEAAGVRFDIEGLNNLKEVKGPCVFIGNHMSTMETFVLPYIIYPHQNVSFVVKRSLVEMPVFKHVMRSRNPVVVNRENPREDLKAVMDQGVNLLKNGNSMIVFPQTTRIMHFDPAGFNSIGVKLAARANVPVIPVALRTDAWGTGKRIKDCGKINPAQPVHFAFGKPADVIGKGKETHTMVIQYIAEKLEGWGVKIK